MAASPLPWLPNNIWLDHDAATVSHSGIGIYTSTCPFSLEGEGWDEGDINGCFYSPHPIYGLLDYCKISFQN